MSLKHLPFAGVCAVYPVGGAPSCLSGAGPAAEDGTSASLAGAGADGRGLPGTKTSMNLTGNLSEPRGVKGLVCRIFKEARLTACFILRALSGTPP